MRNGRMSDTKTTTKNPIDALEKGDAPISEDMSDRVKALFLKSIGERSGELENKQAAKDNERIDRKLSNKQRW
jgi:hypothetical protein